MSPNISLGLCPQNIAVEVALSFDNSYNFSERAFVKYLITTPTPYEKIVFWQRWIHILTILPVSTNSWMFPYFDNINFNKR